MIYQDCIVSEWWANFAESFNVYVWAEIKFIVKKKHLQCILKTYTLNMFSIILCIWNLGQDSQLFLINISADVLSFYRIQITT